MSAAKDVAKANAAEVETKESLAKEYIDAVMARRQAEKKEEFIKGKLIVLMEIGEQIGAVQKIQKMVLDITPEMVEKIEKMYGKDYIRKEVVVPMLREKMKTDAELVKMIPEKPQAPSLKVG